MSLSQKFEFVDKKLGSNFHLKLLFDWLCDLIFYRLFLYFISYYFLLYLFFYSFDHILYKNLRYLQKLTVALKYGTYLRNIAPFLRQKKYKQKGNPDYPIKRFWNFWIYQEAYRFSHELRSPKNGIMSQSWQKEMCIQYKLVKYTKKFLLNNKVLVF